MPIPVVEDIGPSIRLKAMGCCAQFHKSESGMVLKPQSAAGGVCSLTMNGSIGLVKPCLKSDTLDFASFVSGFGFGSELG